MQVFKQLNSLNIIKSYTSEANNTHRNYTKVNNRLLISLCIRSLT